MLNLVSLNWVLYTVFIGTKTTRVSKGLKASSRPSYQHLGCKRRSQKGRYLVMSMKFELAGDTCFDLDEQDPVSLCAVQSGFLVPPGDIPAFADRVRSLLDDQALRKRMSLAAREETERWSWESATAVLRNVQYQKVSATESDLTWRDHVFPRSRFGGKSWWRAPKGHGGGSSASWLMLRVMQGILFAVTYVCPCVQSPHRASFWTETPEK